MPDASIVAAQVVSASVALAAGGSLLSTCFVDVPWLQSQPASRSLPLLRWYFSRGSHIFPEAAFISSAGFAYVAYKYLPQAGLRTAEGLLKTAPGLRFTGFVTAAVLTIGIAPFTTLVMVPNNFALIEKNEEKGGRRSQGLADRERREKGSLESRSVDESIGPKYGSKGQLTDLSGPQGETDRKTTPAEDREVHDRLSLFGQQNLVRALLLVGGGVIGLVASLT